MFLMVDLLTILYATIRPYLYSLTFNQTEKNSLAS